MKNDFEMYRDKLLIADRYRDQLTSLESRAVEILELIPSAKVERTTDVFQIKFGEYGDDNSFSVVLTPEAIELRLPEIEWLGPHTPASTSSLWRRVEWQELGNKGLIKLLTAAQGARAQTFRTCAMCGESNPPGWMFDSDTCESCAEKHLGIVH